MHVKEKKLRYGVIGAGSIADKKHLAGYAALEGVELAAICDSDRDRARILAEKYRIPDVYSDYLEMLDNAGLDFISVCTPNYLHLPVTVAAMEKGIHVHCEKPLAMNAQEARNISKARDKSGSLLMVGLNNRFSNAAFFAKEYIGQGKLGDIYHIRCGWRRRRKIPGRGSWFTDKSLAGGGPLIDLGVHYIDLAMYLAGLWEPRTVTAACYQKLADNLCLNSWAYGKQGSGVFDIEDMAVGFVRFKSNATMDFEFSWASNIDKESRYCEILGTMGGICYRDGELRIHSQFNATLIDIIPDINYTCEAVSEFRHFVDCIRNNRQPEASAEQAETVMRIIDGAYLSAENGGEVEIKINNIDN